MRQYLPRTQVINLFTITRWGYQLLALLGRTRYDDYEVLLEDEAGDLHTMYVVAPNSEQAAWSALELSEQRNCTLKNVRMCDEW